MIEGLDQLSVWLVPEKTISDWWTRQSEMWWYRRFEWRCCHQFLSTARGLHFRRLFETPIPRTILSRKFVRRHGKLLISNHATDYSLWINMSRDILGRCSCLASLPRWKAHGSRVVFASVSTALRQSEQCIWIAWIVGRLRSVRIEDLVGLGGSHVCSLNVG